MKRVVRSRALALLAAVTTASVLLSGCSGTAGSDGDWTTVGKGADETRFSGLEEINRDSVGKLGLEWSLDLPDENDLEGTPLEVDGVLYFNGGIGKIYAASVETGEVLWTYDPKAGERTLGFRRGALPVNRGLAYEDGTIFEATRDGRMIALDAKTGKLKWESEFLIPDDRSASTGAPRVCGSNVIIGNAGAETLARGYVTALNRETGKLAWRFFTVPGNPATEKDWTTQFAAKTWGQEWWKYGGGGTPWNGMTCDKELGQFLVGVGNAAPYPMEFRMKKGEIQDNLFVESLVALDTETGAYKWHYQYNPGEQWDWKAIGNISLADMDIDGKTHKVALQAPSNGFFYVIDRENGKMLKAGAYAKQTWNAGFDKNGRPIEKPGIRYVADGKPITIYPGPLGAHNWQDMSVDTDKQIAYIPYMQAGGVYSTSDMIMDMTTNPSFRSMGGPGAMNTPYVDPKDPEDGKGMLLAWDIANQKVLWKVVHPSIWNGGTMVTKGGLVFQGMENGKFAAFDAANGKELWSFDAKLGIMAPPITYEHKGKQYVSVLVGYGGGGGWGPPSFRKYSWKPREQMRRVLTFAIGGTAKLPETAPRTGLESGVPIVVPGYKPDPAKVAKGRWALIGMCAGCHEAGNGSAIAPDLRASGIAADRQSFGELLHKGLLAERGMPPFPDITDPEIDEIYDYIRQEAIDKAKADAGQGAKGQDQEALGLGHR